MSICDLTILVNSSPKVALLADDLYKDFVDVERITEASVRSFQSSRIFGASLSAREPGGFIGDSYPTLGEQIFNIPKARTESIVKPDSTGNDIWGPPRRGNRWRLYVFIAGMMMIANLTRRRRLRNSDKRPRTVRSRVVRFGARCRDLL